MENHHQKTSSRDIFSFASTPSPDQDSNFEFGCFTPDSPLSDPYKNSPADHLFFNGRLLPHSFPALQQQQQLQSTPTMLLTDHNINSRSTSRTSSVSSKDSLMSSRSNSTNSSRSSVSSARTSSSDNSERRRLYHISSVASKAPMASKVVMAQLYGSSQRWQHIMPVPALKREDSRRKNGGVLVKEGLSNKKQSEKGNKGKLGLCSRFFRSFLMACRECHAMEPSTKDDVLQGDMKL